MTALLLPTVDSPGMQTSVAPDEKKDQLACTPPLARRN